jgi:membrane protein implicated in regulation of membrane protease activity
MLRSNWLYLAIGVVLVIFAYVTAAGYAAWSGLNLSLIGYVIGAIALALQVIIWIANAMKGSAS